MKITVIDHVYLTSEPIQRLQTLGELEIHQEPPKTTEELKQRMKTADIVITGWTNLTKDIIESAQNLKMISIWATTCHYVDLKTAKQKRITVTHVPSYATEAVAEHAFALLLAASRKLAVADRQVRSGMFDWRPLTGVELHGKTLGIIGTGAIGRRVAEIAKTFKMQILAYDKYPDAKKAKEFDMKYVDLQTLLGQSDCITLHVTLTPETEALIGKKEIELMKDGAVLINTSQGKIIDEAALVEALRSGKISCAGLDVFHEEPPAKDNPLFKLDNVVLSPHIGFNTVEAAKRCSDICVDNVAKFLEGRPQNVCMA
jgi:D-3-phosphoglycerate dehydrogenase